MSTEEPDQNIVMFKRKSKKNLRQRRTEEDEAAENLEDADLTYVCEFKCLILFCYVNLDHLGIREKVELYKELRKLREKKSGTSHVTLALGKKTNMEEEIITSNVINE